MFDFDTGEFRRPECSSPAQLGKWMEEDIPGRVPMSRIGSPEMLDRIALEGIPDRIVTRLRPFSNAQVQREAVTACERLKVRRITKHSGKRIEMCMADRTQFGPK